LEAAQQDLSKLPPTPEERILIHQLWLEQTQYQDANGNIIPDRVPEFITFADDTRLQITKICHPQERNIHSSIFGGFLMREAFELAYAVGMLYLKGRPYTIALDDIVFRKPVPIGSILELSSQV
jgi:acyl-coenzyme A thioesterase 9